MLKTTYLAFALFGMFGLNSVSQAQEKNNLEIFMTPEQVEAYTSELKKGNLTQEKLESILQRKLTQEELKVFTQSGIIKAPETLGKEKSNVFNVTIDNLKALAEAQEKGVLTKEKFREIVGEGTSDFVIDTLLASAVSFRDMFTSHTQKNPVNLTLTPEQSQQLQAAQKNGQWTREKIKEICGNAITDEQIEILVNSPDIHFLENGNKPTSPTENPTAKANKIADGSQMRIALSPEQAEALHRAKATGQWTREKIKEICGDAITDEQLDIMANNHIELRKEEQQTQMNLNLTPAQVSALQVAQKNGQWNKNKIKEICGDTITDEQLEALANSRVLFQPTNAAIRGPGGKIDKNNLSFNTQTSVPEKVEIAQGQMIQMTVDEQTNLCIAEVMINNQPCRMVVDTGATHTILDKQWVKKTFPNAKLFPDQRTPKFELFWIDQCLLGHNQYDNFIGLVADLSVLQETFKDKIDGIIGMNVLGQSPFLLDCKNRQFSYCSSELLKSKEFTPLAVRLASTGLLTFDAKSGNKTFDMMLDSGCSLTQVSEKVWPRDEASSFLAKTTDIRTQKEDKNGRLHHLGLAQDFGLTDEIVIPSLTPIVYQENGYDYGLIGTDIFRKFIFYFDFKNIKVAIKKHAE